VGLAAVTLSEHLQTGYSPVGEDVDAHMSIALLVVLWVDGAVVVAALFIPATAVVGVMHQAGAGWAQGEVGPRGRLGPGVLSPRAEGSLWQDGGPLV
jgi:hypothetical protein